VRRVTDAHRIDPGFRDRFLALSTRNYCWFVIGQGVSLIGSWTQTIAQAVLLLSVTKSPALLGAVVAARYLPVLLLAPYAGVIVDRHDRRRTLIVVESLSAAVAAGFGLLVLM
jgi:MFS family permease